MRLILIKSCYIITINKTIRRFFLMSASLKVDLGTVTYTEDYIASIAGYSALECYGLVGMSQKTSRR